MTALLQKAISAVETLPESTQDWVAQSMLDELASEQQWDEAFASSQDKLAMMAQRALADHRAGRTKDIEELFAAKKSSPVQAVHA